ncbi:MAG: GBS Bsp-like repeat-containing protein [Clostridiales Family XIII bacterium]|nr:GBS Bsp-like repeat-containing protein [Clostridiales Family XIII bacterium]
MKRKDNLKTQGILSAKKSIWRGIAVFLVITLIPALGDMSFGIEPQAASGVGSEVVAYESAVAEEAELQQSDEDISIGVQAAESSVTFGALGAASLTNNRTQVMFAGKKWWVVGTKKGDATQGITSSVVNDSPNRATLLVHQDSAYPISPFRSGYSGMASQADYSYYAGSGYSYANNPNGSWGTPDEYKGSTLQLTIAAIASDLKSEYIKEEARIVTRSSLAEDNEPSWSLFMRGNDLTDQKLWPLSVQEWDIISDNTVRSYPSLFWLRSTGFPNYTNSSVLCGDAPGEWFSGYSVSDSYGVRPAFTLDMASVVFTSDASGATSKSAISLQTPTSTSIWSDVSIPKKFTFSDDSLGLILTGKGDTRLSPSAGSELTLAYTDATSGKRISCLLVDNSTGASYYENLAAESLATGNVVLKTDGSIPVGTYTLHVFTEDLGEDDQSDFCSVPETLTLHVSDDTTSPTVSAVAVTRTGVTTADLTFTTTEAGNYWYYVTTAALSNPTKADIKSAIADKATNGGAGGTGIATSGTNTITEIDLPSVPNQPLYFCLVVEDGVGNLGFDTANDNQAIPICKALAEYSHTVTFNSMGGSAVSTRSVASGAVIGALPVPTRDRYTFDGWFTVATGGTQIKANTPVNADVTYYAHWTSVPVVATLNSSQTAIFIETTNISISPGISKVQFAVWGNTGGQNDLKWYTATPKGNGVYQFSVSVSNHKEIGVYNIHAYATLTNGKSVFIGAAQPVRVSPQSGTVSYLNRKPEKGTFQVKLASIYAPSGVSEVQIPVWSKSDQSDIYWYKATKQTDGSYIAYVDIKNHKYNYGTYIAHCYVRGGNGTYVCVAGTSIPFSTPPVTASLNPTQTSISIETTNLSISPGVSKVQFAVWGNTGGQNDLKWYTATPKGNGVYQFFVSVFNHKETGAYNIHVYATLTNGKSVFIGAAQPVTVSPPSGTVSYLNKKPENGTFQVSSQVSMLHRA